MVVVVETATNPHASLTFGKVQNPLCLPRKRTSERPKAVRTLQFFPLLTSKCASRHNGGHFFDDHPLKGLQGGPPPT